MGMSGAVPERAARARAPNTAPRLECAATAITTPTMPATLARRWSSPKQEVQLGRQHHQVERRRACPSTRWARWGWARASRHFISRNGRSSSEPMTLKPTTSVTSARKMAFLRDRLEDLEAEHVAQRAHQAQARGRGHEEDVGGDEHAPGHLRGGAHHVVPARQRHQHRDGRPPAPRARSARSSALAAARWSGGVLRARRKSSARSVPSGGAIDDRVEEGHGGALR